MCNAFDMRCFCRHVSFLSTSYTKSVTVKHLESAIQ